MNKVRCIIISLLIAQSSLYCLCQPALTAKKAKTQAAISSPAPKYRPRVIYFYANWCGVCQHYGPLLKTTVAAYRNYVDFQSFNVDDPSNRALTQRFQIHSIPATFIYNSQGDRVFAQVGNVDQKTLYNVLKGIYAQGAPQPVKKKS